MRRIRTSPPRLPARDSGFAAQIRKERQRRADRRPEARPLDLPPIETDPFDPYVDFVELLLDDGLDETDRIEHADELRATDAMLLAGLVEISLLPGVPEHIMMQIAFGERTGRRNARQTARILARARQRGMSADDYIIGAAARGELDNEALRALFHGETKRRPDDERVRRGIAVILRATAHVDAVDRPALLCIVAWLHWISGRRATALSYVSEAQRIEPAHLLAYGLRGLISTKTPQWL